MIVDLDSETITVSTTVVSLTASKLSAKGVSGASLYCEGSLRFWSSGISPTATQGIPMDDGKQITLSLAQATYFKAIRSGGSDAKLHVQYLRGN